MIVLYDDDDDEDDDDDDDDDDDYYYLYCFPVCFLKGWERADAGVPQAAREG
jgi:hypothetical protein